MKTTRLISRPGVGTRTVDYSAIARRLQREFDARPPEHYVLGKTVLRSAVMQQLGCSEMRAEQIVETLDQRGLIAYDGDPACLTGAPGRWRFPASPTTP